VSSNLIALFELGSVRGIASTRRPRCSILRELTKTIGVRIACQQESSNFFRRPGFGLQQRKMSKHRYDSKSNREALSF
jgi:hypothetical protein